MTAARVLMVSMMAGSLTIAMSGAASSKELIDGATPENQMIGEGALAPKAGKLGPTSRKLHQLRGKVARPTFRIETAPALAGTKRAPTLPADKLTKPKLKPTLTQPSKPVARNIKLDTAAQSSCIAELKALAVFNISDQPVAKDPACIIDTPVQLMSIGNAGANVGGVVLSGQPVLACSFALSFARFTANIAQPLARSHVGSELKTIVTGPGFTCRRRNNALKGKLSEHAFGNAIDIVGFRFGQDKRSNVQSGTSLAPPFARFQKALRRAACGYFTTVLGPGSNQAHAAHLHFDLGRSGKKKNPYRICE